MKRKRAEGPNGFTSQGHIKLNSLKFLSMARRRITVAPAGSKSQERRASPSDHRSRRKRQRTASIYTLRPIGTAILLTLRKRHRHAPRPKAPYERPETSCDGFRKVPIRPACGRREAQENAAYESIFAAHSLTVDVVQAHVYSRIVLYIVQHAVAADKVYLTGRFCTEG